jgi:hypothetical protein
MKDITVILINTIICHKPQTISVINNRGVKMQNFSLKKLGKDEYFIFWILLELIFVLIVSAISWMNVYSKQVFLLWAVPHFITTMFVLVLLFDKKKWMDRKISFYISGFLVSVFLSYIAVDCLISTETTYEIIMRLLPLYILIAVPITITVLGFIIMGIYAIVRKNMHHKKSK